MALPPFPTPIPNGSPALESLKSALHSAENELSRWKANERHHQKHLDDAQVEVSRCSTSIADLARAIGLLERANKPALISKTSA